MQRACVVSQVLRVNSPFNTITLLTLFFFFSFQSACAWSAHQDHRPSWSHRRCVQEEVNSLLPLVSIKCHSSQNPSVRVLLVWSSLESVNYYNLGFALSLTELFKWIKISEWMQEHYRAGRHLHVAQENIYIHLSFNPPDDQPPCPTDHTSHQTCDYLEFIYCAASLTESVINTTGNIASFLNIQIFHINWCTAGKLMAAGNIKCTKTKSRNSEETKRYGFLKTRHQTQGVTASSLKERNEKIKWI